MVKCIGDEYAVNGWDREAVSMGELLDQRIFALSSWRVDELTSAAGGEGEKRFWGNQVLG